MYQKSYNRTIFYWEPLAGIKLGDIIKEKSPDNYESRTNI